MDTPVVAASYFSNGDVAVALIEAGADPTILNYQDYGPANMAAWRGVPDVVPALIVVGATYPTALTNFALLNSGVDHMTPLMQAAYYGNTRELSALMAAGVPLNTQTTLNAATRGETALFLAAMSTAGATEFGVQALLGGPGIDANLARVGGDTPLLIAATAGHTTRLAALLAFKPDIQVNKANDAGDSPLTIAALYNQVEAVKELLGDPDVDVNHQNGAG